MNHLSRWDPFQEVMDVRRMMDRLVESSYLSPDGWQQTISVPMDVCETKDGYEIEASMPGIKPEDVDITLEQNTLTIRGEIKADQEQGDKNYHLRERRSGTFMRSLTLPSSIKAEDIQAHFEDGVLKLHVPKAEESKPKRIQVQGVQPSHQIEGKARDVKTK